VPSRRLIACCVLCVLHAPPGSTRSRGRTSTPIRSACQPSGTPRLGSCPRRSSNSPGFPQRPRERLRRPPSRSPLPAGRSGSRPSAQKRKGDLCARCQARPEDSHPVFYRSGSPKRIDPREPPRSLVVRDPSGAAGNPHATATADCDPNRYSPAIHVNQEGLCASLPKKAMIGFLPG